MISDTKEYKVAVKKLKRWADAYYIDDNPMVSDEVYDRLYHKVKEYESNHLDEIDFTSPTQRVGAPLKDGFKKAKHITPMWSMEDVFNGSELRGWLERVNKVVDVDRYYIEPKFDGASLNLIYSGGKLIQAITRGDGLEGEDVTNNAKAISSIKLEIEYSGLIEIRGEVLMRYSDFERLNEERVKSGQEPFANPRNSASGSLRQLDPKEVAKRNLIFIPWGVGESSLEYKYLSELMDFVYSLGFRKPIKRVVAKSLEEIEATYKELIELRSMLDIMLDGMVIKVDSLELQKRLGYTNKAPRWQVAYKFPAVEKQTEIESISLQVGRSGVITPVANLKPVEVEGVTVERATLNNFDYIKKLDIRVGDSVTLIRSGDVIPKIIKVLKEFRDGSEKKILPPKECPECNSPLLNEGALVKCQNLNCPARVTNSIKHFVSKGCMDINGLGDKIVTLLYNRGLIADIEDIYRLKFDDLIELDGFKERRVKKLLSAIENSKSIECWRFIKALGIEHIGEVASKKVCQTFGDRFLDLTEDEILSIDGFGKEMASSYIDFIRINRDMLNRLLAIITLKYPEKIDNNMSEISSELRGKTVILTGKMDRSRGEIKSTLESLGAKVSNSISKNTDLLIYGDKAGSKLKKAQELGVDIKYYKDIEELKQQSSN